MVSRNKKCGNNNKKRNDKPKKGNNRKGRKKEKKERKEKEVRGWTVRCLWFLFCFVFLTDSLTHKGNLISVLTYTLIA